VVGEFIELDDIDDHFEAKTKKKPILPVFKNLPTELGVLYLLVLLEMKNQERLPKLVMVFFTCVLLNALVWIADGRDSFLIS
jgi:hypothetical protein